MLSLPLEELLSGGLSKVHSSPFKQHVVLFCSSGHVCLFSVGGLWNANRLSFPFSPPDSSSNYIRQLETKVRILEDDNNKLLSQVRHSRSGARQGCRALRRLPRNFFPPARLKPETGSCDETKVVARRLYEARPLATVCPLAGERVYPCIIHRESVSLGSGRRC